MCHTIVRYLDTKEATQLGVLSNSIVFGESCMTGRRTVKTSTQYFVSRQHRHLVMMLHNGQAQHPFVKPQMEQTNTRPRPHAWKPRQDIQLEQSITIVGHTEACRHCTCNHGSNSCSTICSADGPSFATTHPKAQHDSANSADMACWCHQHN
jgi:hypothetical protein